MYDAHMKIAVLGTGMVGQRIASKLVSLKHEVKMGARDARNEKAAAWTAKAGAGASHGTFAEAAAFGEIIFVCTNGAGTIPAMQAAGAANVSGKIAIDVSNPLDASKWGCRRRSSPARRIRSASAFRKSFPKRRSSKRSTRSTARSWSTPKALAAAISTVFVSGNDKAAKARVTEILGWFGWKDVLDLGDITSARGAEAYVLLWVRMYMTFGHASFNVKVVR